MSRVAVLVPPLRGHVNPALAIVAALTARGDEVACWLPDADAPAVRDAGADHRPLTMPPPDPRLPPDDAGLVTYALLPVRLTAAAVRLTPAVLAEVAAFDPDLVLYDVLCPWGHVVAARLGRPAALLCTSYAANDAFSIFASPHAGDAPDVPGAAAVFAADTARLAREHGVALDFTRLFFAAEACTLVLVPRAFHPAGAAFDARYAFVGPCAPPLPDRPDPLVDALDGRPLAFVSTGTVFTDWPAFPGICAEAFGDGRFQVALSTGGPTAVGADALVAAGGLVGPSLPQRALLARAAVSVTHGGMNSTMEALAAGVPLVVVPRTPEQAVTADRVADLGLGLHLPRSAVTPTTLRRAVDRVTRAGGFRREVGRMREEIRAAGGAAAAADVLQAYVARDAHAEGRGR